MGGGLFLANVAWIFKSRFYRTVSLELKFCQNQKELDLKMPISSKNEKQSKEDIGADINL